MPDATLVTTCAAVRARSPPRPSRAWTSGSPWFRASGTRTTARGWGWSRRQASRRFLDWYAEAGRRRDAGETGQAAQVSPDVFGTAPRELTRSVSLQQALELLRTVVDTVEAQVPELAAPGDEQRLREAVLRYSREVAFAAARIYARAAEARGAWDARLEALVVDALLRGEADDALRSRAAALGWAGFGPGDGRRGVHPDRPPGPAAGLARDVVGPLRRRRDGCGPTPWSASRADRMVAVLGRRTDPLSAPAAWPATSAPAPWSPVPLVPTLAEAGRSARAALAGIVAARAWPHAPRPVAADDLLPERLLSGDGAARRALVDRVYRRLAEADPALLGTALGLPRAGPLRRGRRTPALRAPQHGPLPPARRGEGHGLGPRRSAGGLRAPGGDRCGAARGGPQDASRSELRPPFVGFSNRREKVRAGGPARRPSAGKVGKVLAIVCPGQGSQTPGFLAPWLEIPEVAERSPGWVRSPASTSPLTARPPTPRPSATPPSPSP